MVPRASRSSPVTRASRSRSLFQRKSRCLRRRQPLPHAPDPTHRNLSRHLSFTTDDFILKSFCSRDEFEQYFSVVLFCLGGVLEENEVFNNRFDGICLATGVEPQLSSKCNLTHLPHRFISSLLFCNTNMLFSCPCQITKCTETGVK